jgi:hypothetical protein
MTARHAHRPAMASAVVIPLVPHAEADTTTRLRWDSSRSSPN